MEILFLLLSLIIILFCAELFTNAIEHVGEQLSFSQAVVGSILAAVGTALPETIIPLVAIILHKGKMGSDIGIGAILGAPFMLITMGMFVVGLGIFTGWLRKKRKLEVNTELETLQRDLKFFLSSFIISIFLPLLFPNNTLLKYGIAIFLITKYIVYVFVTFNAESNETTAEHPLFLQKFFKFYNKLPKNIDIFLGIIQAIIALTIMVKAAHVFVESLKKITISLGFDPLLFSLIVAPIATELPEKFNSYLWSSRNKDALALGNISGAMVFQSTFPIGIGVVLTPWHIEGLALVSAIVAIILGCIYLFFIKLFKKVPIWLLYFSGIVYIVYTIGVGFYFYSLKS